MHDAYQPLRPGPFATQFWDFYQTLTDIEARFDLIHRRDGGVAAWTANRARHFYDFAAQSGLYNAQDSSGPATAAAETPPPPIPDPVDLIIQTGAGGPAAGNRTRGSGCIYTAGVIRHCLDQGKRVLVVHDAPDMLDSHPNLIPVTFRDFRLWGVEAGKGIKHIPHTLTAEDEDYWAAVGDAFQDAMGVTAPDAKRIAALVNSHRRTEAQHGALLDRLQPSASILMTHYFRAPQIEAAQKRRIWTVDYQHGIYCRYHVGYGYPGLKPDYRDVPYLPDEHWQWGRGWTSADWWPAPLKQRIVGLDTQPPQTGTATPFEQRPEKTLLIASSWAMRDDYRKALTALATQAPDWTFRVKLHPREKLSHYADLAERFTNIELLSGDVDIHAAAKEVRYVTSICSTSLFDVLLDGCHIAVLNLPSVEYAEDFVTQYKVPVLEPDASNFAETAAALTQQDIPTGDIFYSMSSTERRLLDESLDIQATLLQRPTLPSPKLKPFIKRQAESLLAPVIARCSGLASTADISAVTKLTKHRLRSKPREHYRTLHAYLKSEQADQLTGKAKIHLLSAAIKDGIPAPLLIAFIRDALVEHAEPSSKTRKALLQQICAVTDSASTLIRAELLEHLVLSDPNSISAPAWKTGAKTLSSLSSGMATLAHRYEKIVDSAQTAFPDTRVCPEQQDQLAQALATRLAEPEPFSMLRVGDGEVYAFDPAYISAQTLQEDCLRREKIWWDSTLEPSSRHNIQTGVANAILNADFLGIPSIWRLLRDLPRQLGSMRGPIDTWSATARAHYILSEELCRLAHELGTENASG